MTKIGVPLGSKIISAKQTVKSNSALIVFGQGTSVLFMFNPDPTLNTVYMNSRADNGAAWGAPESFHYDGSAPLDATIVASNNGFLVMINQEFQYFFKARIPITNFRAIEAVNEVFAPVTSNWQVTVDGVVI